MKLSRFRRFGTAGKTAVQTSSKPKLRFYLGALATLILGLAASLYFFFPTAALKERIEYEINGRTPVEATLQALSLGFPPALMAEKLSLSIDGPQPYTMIFDKASVRPLWHTLLGGNPGVAVHTGILGGEGEGNIRRDGTLEFSLAGILVDTPLPSLTSLRLSGTLEKAQLAAAVPLKPTTASHLEFHLENIRIVGLKSVGIGRDSLSLGTITLRGEGKGNTLRIEELDSRGGDLKLSGSGTVLLGRSVEHSRLNLNVVLSPEQTLGKDVAEMLNLFRKPARDGSYRFKITGTLANPAIK